MKVPYVLITFHVRVVYYLHRLLVLHQISLHFAAPELRDRVCDDLRLHSIRKIETMLARMMAPVLYFVSVSLLLQPSSVLALSTTSSTQKECKLLILGRGRLGKEIQRWATSEEKMTGHDILYTSRQPKDYNLETILHHLDGITHTLCTIPLNDKDTNQQILKVMRNLPTQSWFGLTSTTGVYGDHQGEWVTEASECRCESENSSAGMYLRMEQAVAESAKECGLRHAIFRCAGIYGNTRSALHTVLKSGIDLNAPPLSDITNRIHETDIARSMFAAFDTDSEIFNLADDLPESRSVVLNYAYKLLLAANISVPMKDGTPLPDQQQSNVRTRRRSLERKLVDNSKIKKLLPGNTLLYPTYIEGLESILSEGSYNLSKL